MDIVVELLVHGGPVTKALYDGVVPVGEGNRNRLLGSMATGLNPEIVEPIAMRSSRSNRIIGIPDSVRVHRTVKIHSRQTIAMWLQHGLDRSWIVDVGPAFIVNDQVIALRIIRVAQDLKRGFCAPVGRMDLIDGDIRPGLEPLLQYFLLIGVVVTASPGDEQDTEGLGGTAGIDAGGTESG